MRQNSGAPAPKRNRRITRRIFPPDSEKSSGNETKPRGNIRLTKGLGTPSNSLAKTLLVIQTSKFIDDSVWTVHSPPSPLHDVPSLSPPQCTILLPSTMYHPSPLHNVPSLSPPQCPHRTTCGSTGSRREAYIAWRQTS